MELDHEFEVPVGADDAFAVLTDIERVAPCMPGATLDEVDGDRFTGRVKVKIGPVQMTYRGTAEMEEKDAGARRATITARGQEARGGGTAHATVTVTLAELAPQRTAVTVHTDLRLTGKPAQFGRGTIADVAGKLLDRFADCLADELSSGAEPTPADGTVDAEDMTGGASWQPQVHEPSEPRRGGPDAIDLLEVAGRPVFGRLVPLLAVVTAVGVYLWWRSRRG